MDTESWEFEDISVGSRESAPSPTSATQQLGGPPPVEPPRRPRPDPSGLAPLSGSSLVSPLGLTAEPADPNPNPPELLAGSPGWGWRAFVAFIAGGLLTGGGFAVGQLSLNDETTTQAEIVPATAPVSQTTVPPGAVPAPTLPIEDGPIEPAQAVAQLLGPSVVQIETGAGLGSGVVYRDGLILTNNHVIEGSTTVTVRFNDGGFATGTVLGSAPNVDIAVVQVPDGIDLPIARLASDKAEVGQTAIAIGSPFSLQQTVTEGIVSAVDRPLQTTGEFFTAMIQTDAPINPGNSGGALADRTGKVIGINTAIQTGGANANAGVGFAIPIDTAVSVADRIVAGEPIESGQLGVQGGQTVDGSAGVELKSVGEGSAAEDAGLLVGDRILSIDGAPVSNIQELAGLVVAYLPGDVIELEVIRDGTPLTIEATLGQR